MKKIYSFLFLFLCSIFSVNAQRNLEVVLKSDYSFNLLTADIDSITFNLSSDSLMLLFQSEVAEGYGINFNRIDTLKFNNDSLELDEPLNEEFEAQLALLPDTVIPNNDLFFEDGQSIYDFLQEIDPAWIDNPPYLRNSVITDASSLTGQQQMKLFLGRMFDMANYIVTRSNHVSQSQPNGLAYVFNGKQIEVPLNPAGPSDPNFETSCPPDPGCSDQVLKGLDCSGMLGLMAQRAGVPITSGPTGAQANPVNWNNKFNSNNSHKFTKLKYSLKNSTEVPLNSLRQGDIVCKPGHIGIILNNLFFSGGNSVLMYQSNGQPKLCPTGTSQPCTNNTSTSRGPRTLIIGESLFNQLFGTNYSILRLDTIACSGGITSVIDIENYEYPVVQIGNQCWMAENLRTAKFNDGSLIPNVITDSLWINQSSPAFCVQQNNSIFNLIYGKLYNWYTVAEDNLCPTGWHIPSDDEWTVLTEFLGGIGVAGGKMKSINGGWNQPNVGATNSSGFNALAAGWRNGWNGLFNPIGISATWWSSTENGIDTAWSRSLYSGNGSVNNGGDAPKQHGLSVRCIKD